jgi:hypothetical protein
MSMSKSDTIWRRLGRGWWLPVVTAVLGAMLSLVINSVRPVTYEVSTRVVFVYRCDRTPSDEDRWCLTSRLFQAILQSRSDEVMRHLGVPSEGRDLGSAIEVDIAGYNQLLDDLRRGSPFPRFAPAILDPPPMVEIRVRHAESATALQISQLMISEASKMPIGIKPTPQPPRIRTYPRRWLGLMVGGLTGLVVGLAAVMVRRFLLP